jgi:hypothetical protein
VSPRQLGEGQEGSVGCVASVCLHISGGMQVGSMLTMPRPPLSIFHSMDNVHAWVRVCV